MIGGLGGDGVISGFAVELALAFVTGHELKSCAVESLVAKGFSSENVARFDVWGTYTGGSLSGASDSEHLSLSTDELLNGSSRDSQHCISTRNSKKRRTINVL